MNNIVILLTACVSPSGMINTSLLDVDKRKKQYLTAVRYYLQNTVFKILVVENTNTDLSPYFAEEISIGRIEILTFNGNNFDKELGKGYGEGIILNYAFRHSKLLQSAMSIVKISGRHIIYNVPLLLKLSSLFIYNANNFIVCTVRHNIKFAVSDLFWGSKDFYVKYLNDEVLNCNESQNVWFEHLLYNCVVSAVADGYKFVYSPLKIDQEGISGSTGEKLWRAHWYNHIIYLARAIRSIAVKCK